jgi:hypothetical protein
MDTVVAYEKSEIIPLPIAIEKLFNLILIRKQQYHDAVIYLGSIVKKSNHLTNEFNLNTFEKNLSTMMEISHQIKTYFDLIHYIFIHVSGYPTIKENKIKLRAVKKIMQKVEDAEHQTLSVLNRLPFSFENNWERGGKYSLARHLANFAGYALVLPAMMVSKKAAKDYRLSLYEIQASVRAYKKAITYPESNLLDKHQLKELHSSMKEILVFAQVSARTLEEWKRLKQECLALLTEAEIGDEITISSKYEHFVTPNENLRTINLNKI